MRYERQHILKNIGPEGQKKLEGSTVAIVGMGSTGTVSAELLARAGVGKLIIIDHDSVEITNLNRQVLYTENDVGLHKTAAAAVHLRSINSHVKVEEHLMHLYYDNIDVLKDADVILDCTDNLQTRFLINDFSRKNNIPWIYAGAVEDRGLMYVTTPETPCFRCIFDGIRAQDSCQTVGILGSASTMVSSMQVTEAIKLILGDEPCKELVQFNVWDNEFRKLKVNFREGCKACNGTYEYLNPDKDFKVDFCQTVDGMISVPLKKLDLDMSKLKEQFKVVSESKFSTTFSIDGSEFTINNHGEIIFHGEKNKDHAEQLVEMIYSV